MALHIYNYSLLHVKIANDSATQISTFKSSTLNSQFRDVTLVNNYKVQFSYYSVSE